VMEEERGMEQEAKSVRTSLRQSVGRWCKVGAESRDMINS